MLGESITCLGLIFLFILAFPRACCICFCFVLFNFFFCVHFFVVKNFKKTKIFLVGSFLFFFCIMHLDSPLNSHVVFMDLIPCVLECS
jgi:hypothetical protein